MYAYARDARLCGFRLQKKAAYTTERGRAMPREPITFQLNLEHLSALFPEREALTRQDIENCTGLSRKTVLKEFPFKGRYISKVNFAWLLSEKGAPP